MVGHYVSPIVAALEETRGLVQLSWVMTADYLAGTTVIAKASLFTHWDVQAGQSQGYSYLRHLWHNHIADFWGQKIPILPIGENAINAWDGCNHGV